MDDEREREGEGDDGALELKGDALNDGFSDVASGPGSRFSLNSRSSLSPRASVRCRQPATGSRRRGRSDATHLQHPYSRPPTIGSTSPADSLSSSMCLTTPARSTRSSSTAAPSLDPRGDQELLMLMDVGEPTQLESLDLSLASRKTKKTLKSFQSLEEFCNLTELNVANNAIGSLDGLDAFPQLTILCISRNHLKRIDSSLFALVNVRSLDLSGNFISHIPRGIIALEVLEVLNLSGNNLGALKEIDVLGKLANLHTCNFMANPFCKLPTYKDYIVSRLLSLEHLDDSAISDHMREKSRRRFSEEMFSKDKFLRDAGIAHATEQSKLREAQLALEAENTKLRDELQLKSKLLQNKSKAWSSATEQLLQLQHDLAMMNLDRRNGQMPSVDSTGSSKTGADEEDPRSNQPEHHSDEADDSLDPGARSSSPRSLKSHTISGHRRSDHQDMLHKDLPPTSNLQLEVPSRAHGDVTSTSVLVDAACSPFVERGSQNLLSKTPRASKTSLTQRQTLGRLQAEVPIGMTSPQDFAIRHHQVLVLDGDYVEDAGEIQSGLRGSLRFPTFEDENGCPAYDGPNTNVGGSTRSRSTELASAKQMESVPLQSPKATRLWERQRSQLTKEISKCSPVKSPSRSQVNSLVEKENLVRQIQALQSCKQSLLGDIASEEQLLHDLKQEASGYTNQIEHLEDDMLVLIGTASRGVNSATSSVQREEETLRAKLEVLRSKLHYVEDKEHEIEATIIRMTKRVLEDDLQYSRDHGRSMPLAQSSCGPFDKEVFALTHSLQMVIIEKEEIHSEMSRLMNYLQKVPNGQCTTVSTGLSPEALLLIDQHEKAQLISPDNQSVFIEKQKRTDELKLKLRVVHDRIKIKEDQIAALVVELKDVESELAYISNLIPRNSSGHRRSLSLDSLSPSNYDSTASIADGIVSSIRDHDTAARSAGGDTSPRKSVSTGALSSGSVTASISSMVEAAAADVNTQFEEKFKELFSPEVLEKIKEDILDKLSRQIPKSKTYGSVSSEDQNDLHAAIAVALEVHMKKAMHSFEEQRSDEIAKGSMPVILSTSPKKPGPKPDSVSITSVSVDSSRKTTKPSEEERGLWDEVDDFMPVADASYASKYRYAKERDSGVTSTISNSKCPRSASLQKIRKACERLLEAESECRIDTFSGIEIDASGRKKSDLKVLVMGARDLPTSHLRTKNLDPYVALEIVYPGHVLPQATVSSLQNTSSVALTHHRGLFTDESSHLPNQGFRSRTIKQSLYPIWDEEFDFTPVHSLKGYLRLRVLNDRKLSREQLVGEVKIPLRLLVNQKKMVETFVLRTPITGFDCGNSRRASLSSRSAGGSSGTIRIQLQLTFSRMEKCKRSLDDLVARHLNEYSNLPDFIERIQDYQARLAGPPPDRNPDPNSADGVSGHPDHSSSIPSFESWKALQAPDAAECLNESKSHCGIDGSGSLASPSLTATSVVGSVHQVPSGLSSERCAALWSTPSTKRTPEAPEAQPVQSKKPSSHTPKSSSMLGAVSRKTQPPASAKAAMAQLRQMVETKVQGTKSLPNASKNFSIANSDGRRKTVAAPPPFVQPIDNPDCFDDYSPYHPDFQLLDPLGMESLTYVPHGVSVHKRSASHSTGLTTRRSGENRRTDLRIFKSPGFSRREPSGGFPERFIGLDTQTSERIKRIFGRIDTQG